jgi:benzoyl-CoA reductase subunit BamC
MGEKKKKIIKTIKIDVDKCNGCRACELICSAFHAEPKYSSNNPARARIRVISEPLTDIYVPVYAGDYAPAECAGRDKYTIDGLKCDTCEGEDEPLCVKWCLSDALTLEEREEEVEEEEEQEELEVGLESLADKHGLEKIMDILARMSKSKKD